MSAPAASGRRHRHRHRWLDINHLRPPCGASARLGAAQWIAVVSYGVMDVIGYRIHAVTQGGRSSAKDFPRDHVALNLEAHALRLRRGRAVCRGGRSGIRRLRLQSCASPKRSS